MSFDGNAFLMSDGKKPRADLLFGGTTHPKIVTVVGEGTDLLAHTIVADTDDGSPTTLDNLQSKDCERKGEKRRLLRGRRKRRGRVKK